MKIKLKIDKDSIVGFLTQNGEKIVFGVGVVLFLLFVFYAFKRETLNANQQPEQLIESVKTAREHIQKSNWEDGGEVREIKYADSAHHNLIDAATVPFPVPFDPPLIQQKQKRSNPPLYAVKKPQVAPGFGAFDIKIAAAPAGGAVAAKGGTKLEARNWCVITAVMPVREQTDAFEKVFDPSTVVGSRPEDVPYYTGFVIQRVEITDANASLPADKLQGWKTLSDKDFEAERRKWKKEAPEIAEKEYVEPYFTMPLGPLVSPQGGTASGWNDFEDDVSHAPEIPAASRKAREKKLAEMRAAAPADAPEEAPEEAGGGGLNRRLQKDEKPEKPAPVGPAVPRAAAPAAAANAVYDKLFRFFDFTVEPGKRYRYRIQLGLKNPNFKVDERFLKANVNRKDEVLVTSWSETTAVVSVPYGNRMLAGGFDQLTGGINVLMIAISKETGLTGSTDFKVTRGSKLQGSSLVKNVEVVDPLGSGKQSIKCDFQTDALVLDLRGGKLLHRDFKERKLVTEPGELLVLDRTGNLAVRNELDDAEQWKQNPPSKESTPGKKPPSSKANPNDILGAPGGAPAGTGPKATTKPGRKR